MVTDGRDRNLEHDVERADDEGDAEELGPEQHRVDTAHDEVTPFDKESRLDDADPEETGG
jgi:hypothetical protein